MIFSLRSNSNPSRKVQTTVLIRFAVSFAIAFSVLASLASAQTGTDPARVFNQAQDAHERGDLSEAIKLYRQAIEIFPDFPEAHLQLGTALRQSGDSKAAETEFRKALELRENWALPMLSLASLLSADGRLEDAEDFARSAMDAEPDNPAGLTALADIALRRSAPQDELRDLLSQLRRLTAGRRVPVSVMAMTATLERSTGEVSAARRTIAQALEEDPKNMLVLAEITEVSLASEDADSALNFSERLLKLNPAADSSLLLRARAQAAAGQNEAAQSTLEKISVPSKASDDLKERLATVTSNDIGPLEAKLKADPNNLEAVARLCLLYRTRDAQRALDYCRLAVRSAPDNLLYAVRYAAALLQAGKVAEATTVLQQLKQKAPENHTIRANLAAALFQQKRWPEARVEYEWIASTQPEKAVTFYFLGIISDEMREYVAALANYERFLRSADESVNRLEVEKVQLRLPSLRRQIKDRGGK